RQRAARLFQRKNHSVQAFYGKVKRKNHLVERFNQMVFLQNHSVQSKNHSVELKNHLVELKNHSEESFNQWVHGSFGAVIGDLGGWPGGARGVDARRRSVGLFGL